VGVRRTDGRARDQIAAVEGGVTRGTRRRTWTSAYVITRAEERDLSGRQRLRFSLSVRSATVGLSIVAVDPAASGTGPRRPEIYPSPSGRAIVLWLISTVAIGANPFYYGPPRPVKSVRSPAATLLKSTRWYRNEKNDHLPRKHACSGEFVSRGNGKL